MRALLILVISVWAGIATAQEEVKIALVGLDPDPRYDDAIAYARIETSRQGDPEVAARMAIDDLALLTDARDLTIGFSAVRVAEAGDLVAAARALAEEGAKYLLLDLPAPEADAVAEALGPDGPLLLNTTAPEDWLRRRCHDRMLHTAASDRMIADALIQHFVTMQWQDVLLLHGKTERDLARAASFTEAAERFRLRIVETREFDLSTNPALREQNNVALLTGDTRDYDAVFIADSFGEFSRYLPYQTALPRPVVGATGLVPLEWHWSLERYGAPQVNSRFETAVGDGRRMTWQDWSVWVAMRAVLTAEAKSRDRDPAAIEAFLRSDGLRLDGSKGAQLSFRPWDSQLRQPILLATSNAIIGIAPLEGFLHQTNTLDSLGIDEPEFACD
ncbi:branched-chain amino acid ABC transporter substrate-binding protein [Maritimibacter dapengensis]|uniref:Branched-chain amino acid ABC transporter substrate-binding protein n=1 Tax=Maritimibacter dapengensis TaxID=2836868 RepID=A0ABS6T120_9RHOB|nr:branched-chain amino acid ABC transporter substrate-binding protein [Maritimibacter dapengensis]MBV7378438.1 branched-chain amino acid ABC transporter substrate-binding protein [Maritimibacter dapengensis]